jgi:hypothetical protein
MSDLKDPCSADGSVQAGARALGFSTGGFAQRLELARARTRDGPDPGVGIARIVPKSPNIRK